jgi:hypothetical protein
MLAGLLGFILGDLLRLKLDLLTTLKKLLLGVVERDVHLLLLFFRLFDSVLGSTGLLLLLDLDVTLLLVVDVADQEHSLEHD